MNKDSDSFAIGAVMELFIRPDDGSLPDFVLTYQDHSEVWQAVDQLLEMSSDGLPDQITVWKADDSGAEQMTLGLASRAVSLGTFETFHVVLENLGFSGVSIPDLGVFVGPFDIAIDYRQGASWNPQNVMTLLRWMQDTGATIAAPWWYREFPDVDSILARRIAE